jgi:hypothetical protein
MKIKFRVSQNTTLDPKVINGLILLKLKDKNYDVLEVTDNCVKFYDNPWVLRWNFQQVRRLDGGSFNISISNNAILVTLHFYLNLFPVLIGVSIPVIGTIVEGAYEGTIFFVIFIIVALFIQTIISKSVARDMLMAILSKDIVD